MDAAYDEKAAAFPQQFAIYREWSAFLEGQGRVQQARQVLLLVQPPTPDSVTRLGLLELRQGRVEEAHRRLEQAMQLATKNSVPSISDAAIRLSRSLAKEGETSKASDVINSALSSDGGNSDLFRELVNITVLKKDVSLTILVCNNAIKSVGNVNKDFFKNERVRQAEMNYLKDEEIIKLEKCDSPIIAFKCDQCSSICSSKGNLKAHKKVHNKVAPTKCRKCLVDFQDYNGVLAHVGKCRKYRCQCGFESKTASQMKLHQVEH